MRALSLGLATGERAWFLDWILPEDSIGRVRGGSPMAVYEIVGQLACFE